MDCIYVGKAEYFYASVFVDLSEVVVDYKIEYDVNWTDIFSLVYDVGFQMHHKAIYGENKESNDIVFLRSTTRKDALREMICKVMAQCRTPPSQGEFPGNLKEIEKKLEEVLLAE